MMHDSLGARTLNLAVSVLVSQRHSLAKKRPERKGKAAGFLGRFHWPAGRPLSHHRLCLRLSCSFILVPKFLFPAFFFFFFKFYSRKLFYSLVFPLVFLCKHLWPVQEALCACGALAQLPGVHRRVCTRHVTCLRDPVSSLRAEGVSGLPFHSLTPPSSLDQYCEPAGSLLAVTGKQLPDVTGCPHPQVAGRRVVLSSWVILHA